MAAKSFITLAQEYAFCENVKNASNSTSNKAWEENQDRFGIFFLFKTIMYVD